MGEYNGKINVSKDSMLFVVNSVFNQGIKESTTKENILKLMPAIYENADDEEIIKMLPYRTYKDLERLIDYIKTSDDIKSFFFLPGFYKCFYVIKNPLFALCMEDFIIFCQIICQSNFISIN